MKQIKFQMALFLSNPIERPDELFYKKIFNEYNQPVILPGSNPFPGVFFVDTPVVQATSKNGIFDLSISNKRLDLTKKNFLQDMKDDVVEQYYEIVKKNIVYRVGFVAQFFEKSDDSCQIFKNYLKMDDRVSDVSIRYNKKTYQNNVCVNDVMSIQDIELVDNGKKQKGVLFTRDINTDSSSKKELKIDEILKLYHYSNEQFASM